MPKKWASNEEKLAYQRAWYAAHRERVIAKVAQRKKTLYAGVCRNCGGPTQGMTKGKSPEWCSKPECASVQRQLRRREFTFYGADNKTKGVEPIVEENKWAHKTTTVKAKGRFRIFCSCGWQSSWSSDVDVIFDEARKHTGLKEKERRPDGR